MQNRKFKKDDIHVKVYFLSISLQLCVDVISDERAMQEVHFNNFLPGSVIIFKVSLKPKMTKATHALR